MSLSTQLARGTLALPMLSLFLALGLAGGPRAETESLPTPVAQVEAALRLCIAPTRKVLVLAQAPADLGQLAIRWSQPCRA